MLIPTNLIKAMVKVISPKNFSPALTYLYYSKDDNAFIGTDSFTLLKFYPVGPALQKDMYINFNEMKAIKCMGTKDDAIDFTEQPDGTIGINGIESECVFFMKPIDDILAKYPDTNQPSLFGSVKGELQRLPITEGMKEFQEVAQIIGGNGNNATITDITLQLIIQNDFGRYELTYRRPNID